MHNKQRGAFLVIALIMLIVISGLGVAIMAMSTTSERISNNYSLAVQARVKAISLAGYAERILDSWANGVYFGPGSCATTLTCNKIDSTFPMSGRPLLPWTHGTITNTMFMSSDTDSWWDADGFAYEGAFAGSGNARIIVTSMGANPSSPYQNTYRVVGYATDSSLGIVKATWQKFHVWESYPADRGDGTCAGSCNYALCCSDTNVCAGDANSCENGSATYVPPGWTCTDYFVTGLGYSSSACNNPVAPP